MNPTQLSKASGAEPASRWYNRLAILGFILGAGFPRCYASPLIYAAWSQPELPPDVVRIDAPYLVQSRLSTCAH